MSHNPVFTSPEAYRKYKTNKKQKKKEKKKDKRKNNEKIKY